MRRDFQILTCHFLLLSCPSRALIFLFNQIEDGEPDPPVKDEWSQTRSDPQSTVKVEVVCTDDGESSTHSAGEREKEPSSVSRHVNLEWPGWKMGLVESKRGACVCYTGMALSHTFSACLRLEEHCEAVLVNTNTKLFWINSYLCTLKNPSFAMVSLPSLRFICQGV